MEEGATLMLGPKILGHSMISGLGEEHIERLISLFSAAGFFSKRTPDALVIDTLRFATPRFARESGVWQALP